MPHEILVLYYSELGGTQSLAEAIAAGIESVDGVQARMRTVPGIGNEGGETTFAPPYVTHDDLDACIGLALGSPTRFGNMAAPLKHFLDTTSAPWTSGALVGKPACVFTTVATMHGGHESTLLSMMIPLLHHGMIILGCPYTEPALNQTVTGGSPYGPSHYSGLQSNLLLSMEEKIIALTVGKRLAKTAITLFEQRKN